MAVAVKDIHAAGMGRKGADGKSRRAPQVEFGKPRGIRILQPEAFPGVADADDPGRISPVKIAPGEEEPFPGSRPPGVVPHKFVVTVAQGQPGHLPGVVSGVGRAAEHGPGRGLFAVVADIQLHQKLPPRQLRMNVGLHAVRQEMSRVIVGVDRVKSPHLLEIPLALDAVSRRAGAIQGGHQKRRQDGDDRNHD